MASKDGNEIYEQVGRLRDAFGLMRFKTASVLSHYYGVGGMLSYGSVTVGGVLDPTLPSTRLKTLESMTHANALRGVIDTALSQYVRIPDLRVQTIGSRWGKQRSARKIGQWLSGSFRRANLQDVIWQVAIDASTCPIAGARVWFENDGLHLARVRPDQIIYNPREGKNPRNLWLRYGVSRDQMKLRYPGKAAIIADAQGFDDEPLYSILDLVGDLECDHVEVIEHWKLGSNGKPGTHTVMCGPDIIEQRPWKHAFFGLIELVDCRSFNSFAGHSLGEQLLPYQLMLNRMSRTIEQAQARLSIGRVYLPKGSEVDKQQFSRTPGEFIEFNNLGGAGSHPIIQSAQACSPDYYQRFENIMRDMYQLAGVSQSQGAGTIPAGMAGASGKAMREYNDVSATRLKSRSDGLDTFFERLSTAALALAVEHFKSGGEMSVVRAPGTQVLEEVKWEDLDVSEDDGIEVRCVSVSGLPAHPSAKLEYVKELVDAGFVNKRYATKLLSIPDVDKIEDIETSAMDLATKHIEDTLYDGRVVSPEPNAEYLEILLDLGMREMMNAIRLEAPPENIELMRRLLETATDQRKKMGSPATPSATAAEPAMSGQAPATPAASVPQAAPSVPDSAARWA